MNLVAEELTGWTAEEALGQRLDKVFQIVHKQTRRTLETPADRVKRFSKVAALTEHVVLLGRNGRETHMDDSGAPIWDDTGVLSKIVLVFRNND